MSRILVEVFPYTYLPTELFVLTVVIDASQSRISDHLEIRKDENKQDHDPKDDGDGNKRTHYADRNRRNGLSTPSFYSI